MVKYESIRQIVEDLTKQRVCCVEFNETKFVVLQNGNGQYDCVRYSFDIIGWYMVLDLEKVSANNAFQWLDQSCRY